MSRLKYLTALIVMLLSFASHAESGRQGFGLNVASGIPFLAQAGAHFYFSNNLSISGGYNLLDLKSGEAQVKLAMPEVMVNYHPFSGVFFVGAGLGKESLEISATESTSSNEIKLEVEANTTILKLGWMWGSNNGGFWYGLDLAYIIPSSPKTTITAPGVPTSDPNYQDAIEAGEKFADTSYINFTFARFGWLF
jgi:hypothetical protein